jgi:hypothetical protein
MPTSAAVLHPFWNEWPIKTRQWEWPLAVWSSTTSRDSYVWQTSLMTITVIQLFTALLVHICSVSHLSPPFLCEHNLLCLNLSARLIGALRLLCRLSSSSRQRSGPVADAVISDDSISAWRDPAVVSALVSFLPRSVRFGQHQVMMMTCHSVFYDDRFSSWSKRFFCVSLFLCCLIGYPIDSSGFSFLLFVCSYSKHLLLLLFSREKQKLENPF